MKKTILLILSVFFVVKAGYSQSSNDILNVLTRRNLISQAEADSLRSEALLKQKEADAQKKSFQITSAKPLQISGYTQVRYQGQQESGKVSGFDVRRARLDFKGTISPSWGFRLHSEFWGASPKLVDIVAEYKFKDYLNFTLGQQKVPLSLENMTSSSKLDFIELSQSVSALAGRTKDIAGDQNGNDIGFLASGSFLKVGDLPLFDYRIGIFNGSGINVADNNDSKDVAAHIVAHPVVGLDLGGSYYDGVGYFALNSGATSKSHARKRWGLDLTYTLQDFSVKGEYLEGKDATIKRKGYYVQAAYFVIPQTLQLLGRYDQYDSNTSVDNDASTWYFLGLNYNFNANTRIQFNYIIKDEQGTSVKNNIASLQFQIGF